MRVYCYILTFLVLTSVNALLHPAHAQLGFDLKIDKPEPFEDRQLKSEKSTDKKLKGPGKFFQNLTTHYNYYFNANNKLNEVILGAKESHKEDYSILLPFYNYSLDITAQNTKELDSVIYKAQTGIVMHDLRNDWADNMYLLWGAAWYLEKKFDSASLMFQFINYAFAEKEKDGYYKYIGSRMDGNNALSISTKEKDKFLGPSPSRNDAFMWQVRSMMEMGDLAQAGSLLVTLRKDPLFPKRLKDELEELQALWFYKQKQWDSSATHLVLALDQATTKQELARWEYLAAQMFELAKKNEEAKDLYTKAIKHTTDPVMDIYSRLNLVRINKDGSTNIIEKNIEELLKMAKRDKYTEYRDVIYYMAAQMEMERNNPEAAEQLFLKASKYNNNNIAFKSKAFLQAADLSYNEKKYAQASRLYDSIQPADLTQEEMMRVDERKPALKKIISYLDIIARQDSLQKIAAMTEEERTEYISKMLKQIEKSQGGVNNTLTSGNSNLNNANNAPTDLFSNSTKGEWYFYNQTLKTQGQQKFKQSWGNRPNVDNWRRFADVSKQVNNNNLVTGPNVLDPRIGNKNADNGPSFNSLLANVPMTPEAMNASNDSIRQALFSLGMTYLSELSDYPSAIKSFESIRTRFPNDQQLDEVLFNLYYAYKKSGDEMKAAEIKSLLLKQYPKSRYATILTTGKDPLATNGKNPESTKAYEAIYDKFLEGNFNEAIAAKRIADSTYKTSYWQPQLLYIEALYHVKQREDSLAKNLLYTLINQNTGSPLALKAQTMIDVLNRRKQIEAELENLKIDKPKEDTSLVVKKPEVKQVLPPAKQDTVAFNKQLPKKDSVVTAKNNAPKKDSVVAKNSQPQKDSVAVAKNNPKKEGNINQQKNTVVPPPVVLPKTGGDTVGAVKPIVQAKPESIYHFDAGAKHSAMIILDKVDPMFANEAKNAFTRYNKEKYYNQNFDLNIVNLDDTRKLLIISGFANAADAVDYVQKAKKVAHLEIIPWLKNDKYSFSIMSDPNLPILLEKKDLQQYSKFLDQNLPGKL